MSGGSYNYASIRDIDVSEPSEDHVALVQALADYPGTEHIQIRAMAAIDKWRQAATIMREVEAEWIDLRPVLKAVEWEQSGDYERDDVRKAAESLKP